MIYNNSHVYNFYVYVYFVICLFFSQLCTAGICAFDELAPAVPGI